MQDIGKIESLVLKHRPCFKAWFVSYLLLHCRVHVRHDTSQDVETRVLICSRGKFDDLLRSRRFHRFRRSVIMNRPRKKFHSFDVSAASQWRRHLERRHFAWRWFDQTFARRWRDNSIAVENLLDRLSRSVALQNAVWSRRQARNRIGRLREFKGDFVASFSMFWRSVNSAVAFQRRHRCADALSFLFFLPFLFHSFSVSLFFFPAFWRRRMSIFVFLVLPIVTRSFFFPFFWLYFRTRCRRVCRRCCCCRCCCCCTFFWLLRWLFNFVAAARLWLAALLFLLRNSIGEIVVVFIFRIGDSSFFLLLHRTDVCRRSGCRSASGRRSLPIRIWTVFFLGPGSALALQVRRLFNGNLGGRLRLVFVVLLQSDVPGWKKLNNF